ncbi:MAG TPA: M48 family metalloprotease [Candidatus Limnocylindrales bacterium]
MRLNPFAFPSDTTFRFLLLIAAIVGVSLLAFDWLYGQFADLRSEALALLACSTGLQPDPSRLPTDAQLAAFRSCLAAVNGTRLDAVLFGVVVLVIGGGVAYAIAVYLLRRRYRPLERSDAPELAAQIDELAGEMGVTPTPGLRWQPLDRRALGLAFGPPGRRELALTGGLVPLTVRDPAAFRAIVLHELAHLRNGDVDLSYYAIGIFRAVLVLAIAPFALALLRTVVSDPGTVFSFVWRFTALLPLVYVIRSSILRAREHDADLRASTLEPEIRRVLAAARDHTPSKVRRLIAWHPSAARRVAVIDDPSPLLHLGILDAFGVGLVGSLAYEEVATLVGYFGFESFATRGLSGLAFGPLVGIIVALGTWRQTFAYLATGRGPVRVVPLALALVAGLFVGQRLSLLTAIADNAVILRPDPGLFHVWLALIITAGALLFVAWLVASSRIWLPVATLLRSPARASVPVALGAAALVTIAIGLFEIVVASREAVEIAVTTPSELYAAIRLVIPDVGPEALFRLVMSAEVRIIIDEPLVIAFFLLLVLVPWAAAPFYARIPARPAATWGSLDPGGDPPRIDRPELHAIRAVGAGVAVAVAIAVVVVIVHAALVARFDAATRDTDEFLVAFAFWLICVTLGGQVIAGAAAGAWAPRFGTLHGVLAGLVAGLAGTLVVGVSRAATGCVQALAVVEGRPCGRPPTIEYLSAYISPVLTIGIVGAGIGAAVAAGIRWLVVGRRANARAVAALGDAGR